MSNDIEYLSYLVRIDDFIRHSLKSLSAVAFKMYGGFTTSTTWFSEFGVTKVSKMGDFWHGSGTKLLNVKAAFVKSFFVTQAVCNDAANCVYPIGYSILGVFNHGQEDPSQSGRNQQRFGRHETVLAEVFQE